MKHLKDRITQAMSVSNIDSRVEDEIKDLLQLCEEMRIALVALNIAYNGGEGTKTEMMDGFKIADSALNKYNELFKDEKDTPQAG